MGFAVKLRLAGVLAGRILVLLLATSLFVACVKLADDPPTVLNQPTRAASQSIPFEVYFSDPTSPTASTKRGGPDQYLAQAIRQSRLSVDVAAYDLDLWSIRDALLAADRRGVRVRLVTDSDNLTTREIQELKDAGVPVLGDRREGLMHNKFVIIDHQDVWSGSMNLTINSAYKNDDNLIHIHSLVLADNYTVEFEEMFVNDRFGLGSPANTPNPVMTIDGSRVEVYFSPDDGVEDQIVNLIQSAQESIRFMAYSFTSDNIAQAMIDRAGKGVQVSGVMEAGQVHSNLGTEYEKLLQAGVNVRKDGNPNNMHHKVIIIDERVVITGSYNFTKNAETKNDENLLVVDNRSLAKMYLQEFIRVFDLAAP